MKLTKPQIKVLTELYNWGPMETAGTTHEQFTDEPFHGTMSYRYVSKKVSDRLVKLGLAERIVVGAGVSECGKVGAWFFRNVETERVRMTVEGFRVWRDAIG